ncbi:MAG TPA: hypothetical protein VIV55_02395 [Flavobacterium sp.]
MKKNILIKVLYIFSIVLFSACSNDNDENNTAPATNPILIKKITETVYYSGTSDTYITDYKYENNVLKSITNDNNKTEFVYDGDKISKLNYFKNGTADGFTSYYYTGDLLSYTLSGKNQDEKTEYFYTNGVLTSEKSGYLDGTIYVFQERIVYSFNEAKNITQSIKTSLVYGPETVSKEIYSYDNKNHPMKYMNKYYRLGFDIEGFDGKTINNVVSRESYYPITNTVPNYYNYEIVYNSDNFPTEIKKIAVSGNNLISKTTIEYQ